MKKNVKEISVKVLLNDDDDEQRRNSVHVLFIIGTLLQNKIILNAGL